MVRVWDLPIRLFHWTLAGLIAFSWYSAEEQMLDWHLRSGMAILFLLTFRILWGFFGSSTARFSQFVKGPAGVLAYVKGKAESGLGHNPLGALSVIGLLGVVGLQTVLGLFAEDNDGLMAGPFSLKVSPDTAETLTDLHEALFNVLLALIVLHLAAIIYYAIRGKKLVGPMVTGKAKVEGDAATHEMQPGKPWVALACAAVAAAVTWLVWSVG
ncbi:MAG: cytochrome b/b6 domain-containing protein [Sphingomonadaceae bacterium]|nr:cytochrome b/b6 domain-containing protein [Sphingomonadaceae bacterium]